MLGGTNAHSQQFLVMLRFRSTRPVLPSFPLAAPWHCTGVRWGRGCPCPSPGPGSLGQSGGCRGAGDMATTSAHGPIRCVAVTEGKGCMDVLVRRRAGKEQRSHCAGGGINSTEFLARTCVGKSRAPHRRTGAAAAVCANGIPVQTCRCGSWLHGECYRPASDLALVMSN